MLFVSQEHMQFNCYISSFVWQATNLWFDLNTLYFLYFSFKLIKGSTHNSDRNLLKVYHVIFFWKWKWIYVMHVLLKLVAMFNNSKYHQLCLFSRIVCKNLENYFPWRTNCNCTRSFTRSNLLRIIYSVWAALGWALVLNLYFINKIISSCKESHFKSLSTKYP